MAKIAVAPLVGAWIEITYMEYSFHLIAVAPLVGAWIEIETDFVRFKSSPTVAPLVGAWIEISVNGIVRYPDLSLPSWERGLKFYWVQ